MTDEPTPPQGAILSDEQIRKLRIAVTIMTAILVVGVVTLVGRVIYLANRGKGQAVAGTTGEQVAGPPRSLTAAATLVLPQGAVLKSAALSGDRILAHYTSARGDGLMILDLVTGAVASHVRIDTSP